MGPSLCAICEKHKTLSDFIIFEDNDLILSHMPVTPAQDAVYAGYCFIEPKKHLTELHELSDSSASKIGLWLRKLSLAHSEVLDVHRTYFFKFADITPHYHVHVYPRHLSTPPELVGEAVRHWAEVPKLGRSEVLELVKKMKAYFL